MHGLLDVSRSLSDRDVKLFDTNLERVANPLGLNVGSSADRNALYTVIKMVDRVALGFDHLAVAERNKDSMNALALPDGKRRARFVR